MRQSEPRKVDEKEKYRSERAGMPVVHDEDSQSECAVTIHSSTDGAASIDENILSRMSSNGMLCVAPENLATNECPSDRQPPTLLSTYSRSRGWESFSSFVSIPEDEDLQLESKAGSANPTDSNSFACGSGAFVASFSSLGGSRSDLDSDIASKQRVRPSPKSTPVDSTSASNISEVSVSEHETITPRPTYFTQLSSRFGLSRGNSGKVLTTLDDRIAKKVASFGFTRPAKMTDIGAKQEKESSEKSDSFVMSQEGSGRCGEQNLSPNETLLGDDFQYGEFGGDTEDGLAVALAVEEDDDAYLPAAVEFDPDAKPSIASNPRFRLCVLLINIVVIVGIVGAAVGTNIAAKKSKDGIPFRETLGIQENVASIISDESLLSDPQSSFRKALNWIMHEDPLSMLPNNTHFFQRFLLVRLYFATTESGDWNGGCTPPEDGIGGPCFAKRLIPTDGQGQVDTKRGKSYSTEPGKHWLSDTPECEWAGVGCDKLGQVRSLRFSE